MDLANYLDLQKNSGQRGTQLVILLISIVYVVQVISVNWFGDVLIDFDTATELGLRYLHQIVLPETPVIWVDFHVHTAPGFTGSGAKHFCTFLECPAIVAEN